MKIKNENKSKNTVTIDYENKKLSVFYFLPLLLIAGFVPLIVYAKYVDLTDTTQALYWTGQQQYLDFFSYWKSWWVVALATISLLFYVILYVQRKLPLKNLKQYYIPLGIYALFVIMSTMFAIDKPTALWGFIDMYQGMFVLLSYVLLTFLTINFVNNKRDVSLFVNAFLFLMIVEGIIGVGQYFGFDFFKTSIGESLIIPGNLVVEGLSFSFGPKTIYGTLFNTNFVGSFATLMLPLSIGIFLSSETRNKKIVSGIAVLLMIFVLIGCNSRAGYFGVAVGAVLGIWLFRKMLVKHWKMSVGFVAIVLVAIVGLNVVSGGALINRLKTFNVSEQIAELKRISKGDTLFEEIALDENCVSLRTNKEILNLKVDDNKIYFLDENFNELRVITNRNQITIVDPKYSWYRITIPVDYPGVSVTRGNNWNWATVNFFVSENGIKILGSGGRLSEELKAEKLEILDGLERFMSGRGYIWSRTIPIMYDSLATGVGPDNYPMAFPQDDFSSKLNAGMDANTVIDKPHNMYLQTAINTGVISLIALFVVWLIYFINSLILYSKTSFDSVEKLIGATCFVGITGYLFAAIFNDSITSVAPIFWIILGLGISINIRTKKNIIQ